MNTSGICPSRRGAEIRSLPIMNPSTHIATRLLIWLAAISAPLQGLSAATCESVGRHAGCQADDVEHGGRPAPTDAAGSCSVCTSNTEPAGCCCGGGTECRCGADCHCSQQNQPEPAVPPAESGSPLERVVADGVASIPAVASHDDKPVTRTHGAVSRFNAATALDRCAALCRFAL